MKGDWPVLPLWSVADEIRHMVEPTEIGNEFFHYSIPVVDETGNGRTELASDVESAKLVLSGGEVLVSKLNPRKGRVLIAKHHELPVIASPEFIALRPSHAIVDRFLAYVLTSETTRLWLDANVQSVTRSHQRVTPELVRHLKFAIPPPDEQRRIADFLDAETARINQLVGDQFRMLDLLEERVDSRILEIVGQSRLVGPQGAATVPLRRLLMKLNRATMPTDEVITAFRDGQVTSRSIRRSEGYTLASSADPQGQGVEVGDVVVHGLDGFAGAIGDSEAGGNCSPVYHICTPLDDGNPTFYGRLLRVLAVGGYLGLFATSTRERAVDFRTWELFGNIPVPQVDPPLQHEIGHAIWRIRPLRQEITRFSRRLAERRQALITAAVAGQIDVTTVPGVAPSGGASA
jgi:type I restriction enzyme S subunit